VMTANWLGRNVPLHASSSGKAWLAWLPPAEAATLMGSNLNRYTPTTIVDADELRAELAVIRNQGYGTCCGEFEPQLFGVSAPLLVGGRPVAVVSIWGPSDRLTPDRFGELGSAAVAAAAEIGGVFRPERESA
jgi:DNA-binding IclR family transcriptional regulator